MQWKPPHVAKTIEQKHREIRVEFCRLWNFSFHLRCAAFGSEHGLNITKQTTGILFSTSRWRCHAKCLWDATTESSILAAAKAQALSICCNYWEKSACCSFAVGWNLPRSRLKLISTDLSVWFLITRGADLMAVFSTAARRRRCRRPFAVGDERATSKCDLTSCKATGHLPCIFIEWSGWGQRAVLRGNTINYTPRCSGWERLTARRSNWKRNIRNRGKHKLWRRREKGKEGK